MNSEEAPPLSHQEVSGMIEKAIRALKSDLERAQLDKEREAFSKRTAREMEWMVRIISCIVVAMLTLAFSAFISNCTGNISELRDRINTLESKESKK
jgi:t-SNARE complex subunit (syntaxin)